MSNIILLINCQKLITFETEIEMRKSWVDQAFLINLDS